MASRALSILHQLYEYDSFLDSITSVADIGCGTGEEIEWWATLTTRDDPPESHNYKCFAIDNNESKLAQVPDLPNLTKLNRDFNNRFLSTQVDLMTAFDCLHLSINPLETLKLWNEQLNVNGMLILTVPQHSGVEYNRYYSRTYNNSFYNYTPTNLIYMLAVNGFDCRDAYLRKQFNHTWIDMAVYKSDIEPMDPVTTTWFDLIETGLLHPTVENSIIKNGHLRQEDIIYPWLDRENYYVDYTSQYTELPSDIGAPTIAGVFNTETAAGQTTVKQSEPVKKETRLSKAIGIMRPQKKKYD